MNPAHPAPPSSWRFWLLALLAFGGVIWLLSDMLMPFVAGIVIAYLLDPICRRLCSLGLSRGLAAFAVLGSFFLVLGIALALVLPVLHEQALQFLSALPGYIELLRAKLAPLLHDVMNRLSDEQFAQLKAAAAQHAEGLSGKIGQVVASIWQGGAALLGVLSLLIITPVVAFYLLRDWPQFTAKVDGWLPLEQAQTIRTQLRAIDATLAGFMRGQLLTCVLLGLGYGIALSLVGLNFGFAIGLTAGLLSFIPYIGSVVGLGAALIVAFIQFGDMAQIGLVLLVFVVGQLLEGNVITPKLVGESVGLHPVWIMFAILAGGSLMGFTGMLLAVPVAATLGVLLRFFISRYLASRYYRGAPRPNRRIRPL